MAVATKRLVWLCWWPCGRRMCWRAISSAEGILCLFSETGHRAA